MTKNKKEVKDIDDQDFFKSIQTVMNGIEKANRAGAYSLSDSAVLFNSIESIKHFIEKQLKKQEADQLN